jgi:hypothetical protein
LAFHFSDFPVIFYAIYKKQGKGNTIGVTFLQERPWKDFCFCNVAPGAAGRRGLLDSDELAAVLGRGRARGGSRVWLGSVSGLGWGWSGSGKRARR